MFLFLIAILVIIATIVRQKYLRPNNYPPGPPCFPFIGSWYSVPGQGVEKKVANWRKKYGNIIGHKIGSQNLVLITGYNETVSALKNPNFQNRLHTSTVLFRTYYKALGFFFADGEQFNEVRRFTVRFLGQMSGERLEFAMHEEMMEFFSTIKSGKVVEERIADHKESFNPENIRDYIDAFLLEQEKERKHGQTQYYTDEELVSCLLDLEGAASESAGNTAAFLLMYVALHPWVQYKMHEELDSVLGKRYPTLDDKSSLSYCMAVMYETMRINTVAAVGAQHIVSEETKFYGYTLPEGTVIIFPLWDLFRNPNEFDDPISFKPERFTTKEMKSKVIAFGLGKRACVAELITKNMIFLFVTYFFQKYSVSLPNGYQHPNTEAELGFTNCAKSFQLVITERQSI